MAHPRPNHLLLLLIGLLAGCGGSDPTSPPGNGNNPPPNNREIKANPSFSADINEIFQRTGCAGAFCHGAAAGQASLRLTASAANNFSMLVNVDASSEPFTRVLPGDATNSYLVIKVEGRQDVGQQMPLNAPSLDDIDRTNIRNWIDNGAPNN